MQDAAHWDAVYRTKQVETVSWFQPSPQPSLKALDDLAVPPHASLIAVGGGASSLVDRLIDRGWSDVTVLDIAAAALDVSRNRLGDAAQKVRWEVGDVTTLRPARTYDIWHDRAVFHFLTTPAARGGYRAAMTAGTARNSLVIMATFAPDGPDRCSGLIVQRYDAASLSEALGPAFRLIDDWREEHLTPSGGRQAFNWCVFRR